jgi:DNA repair exonuclease SbcCD ATPase subunit
MHAREHVAHYRQDVLRQLLARNYAADIHLTLIEQQTRLTEENKKLAAELKTIKEELPKQNKRKAFNPYLTKLDDVEDIDSYIHEDNTQTDIRTPKAPVEPITRDERRELMESMVKVMRDKAQMMDSMLQLTNYLQDAEQKLEEKTDLVESLEKKTKDLEIEAERYRAEGDNFLLEISRRDAEIEELDSSNKAIITRIEEVTRKFKGLELRCKEFQELGEMQSKFLQEQYKNHQEQLASLFEQFEQEKTRRMKVEVYLEEKFNIKASAIPNIPTQKLSNDVKLSNLPSNGIINQIKLYKRIVRVVNNF